MNAKISEKVKFYKEFNELAVKGEIAVFGSTYSAEFPFYELIQGRADYAGIPGDSAGAYLYGSPEGQIER